MEDTSTLETVWKLTLFAQLAALGYAGFQLLEISTRDIGSPMATVGGGLQLVVGGLGLLIGVPVFLFMLRLINMSEDNPRRAAQMSLAIPVAVTGILVWIGVNFPQVVNDVGLHIVWIGAGLAGWFASCILVGWSEEQPRVAVEED